MAIDFHMDFNPTEPKRYPVKKKQDEHLNLFGSVDENAAREEAYQEALKKYATPNTCTDLAGVIESIKSEIQNTYAEKANNAASGGSGRPQMRKIGGYTRRLNELVATSNQWKCQQYADQQAHQQYLNDLNSELQSASKLGDQDKTSKYLVIGGVGFIALISLLIIFR